MKKVAEILIEFGMDFEYNCYHSEGEKITCFPAGLTVTEQNGHIYLDYCGDNTKLEQNDDSWVSILSRIRDIMVEETT